MLAIMTVIVDYMFKICF